MSKRGLVQDKLFDFSTYHNPEDIMHKKFISCIYSLRFIALLI